MSLLGRFTGTNSRLVEALCKQAVLANNALAVTELAAVAEVKEFVAGDILVRQDDPDTDVFFILAGTFRVLVNDREVAFRKAGDHIGEMAVIDPSSRRTATNVASEPSVVAKIAGSDFLRIANTHPALWRAIALELCRRLNERKQYHKSPNTKPRLFIGSSKESLAVAEAIKFAIPADVASCALWSEGVFGASTFPIDDLETQLAISDFAVLVTAGDDTVISRRKKMGAPRDNVVFELGMFMGGLSRRRVFLLAPQGISIKIPSDLLGINRLHGYVSNERSSAWSRLLGRKSAATPDISSAAAQLVKAIQGRGPK
jgi:CRP/FNR family cyclic AMP-dependent transcriptional regulator